MTYKPCNIRKLYALLQNNYWFHLSLYFPNIFLFTQFHELERAGTPTTPQHHYFNHNEHHSPYDSAYNGHHSNFSPHYFQDDYMLPSPIQNLPNCLASEITNQPTQLPRAYRKRKSNIIDINCDQATVITSTTSSDRLSNRKVNLQIIQLNCFPYCI